MPAISLIKVIFKIFCDINLKSIFYCGFYNYLHKLLKIIIDDTIPLKKQFQR